MQDDRNERLSVPSATREMVSRLQSIRDNLISDPDSALSVDEHRAALDAVDGEIAARASATQEGTTHDDSIHRLAENGGVDRYSHLLDRHGSTSPSSIAHSRRRLNRPLDTIQRYGDRALRLPATAVATRPSPPHITPRTLPDMVARRSSPPRRSSRLPQLTPSQPSRARQRSDEQDSDIDNNQGRHGKPLRKRRKLDDGTAEQSRPEYGVEGTLIPGSLHMEILDLDEDTDTQSHMSQIAKSKLCLPDNKDAYRTQRSSCDLLMKHSGSHPFALSKLIVKLPQRDYNSPALQGMVFVSMNYEDLIAQSSHYDSYTPVSRGYHRRHYDSYRPPADYMRSARSPHPSYRTRPIHSLHASNNLWCDSRLSNHEVVEIPALPGISTTLERIVDPEESSYGPRSPRSWDPDHEYPRRTYMDRYSSAASRARDRAYVTASIYEQLSPSTSEDEDEDELDPEHNRGDEEQDDSEATPSYRGVPPSQRDLDEAEVRQRNLLEHMRLHRDQAEGYSYVPSDPRRGEREPDNLSAETMAILAEHDEDAFPQRVRSRATGANAQSPRPLTPQFHSTKRLPGCTGMLQGQSPHSASDRDPVVPHAMFSLSYDGGGAVAINFSPEVSGVYILVKLWALCSNSVVNVQNVLPYGYGTVRQMADIEFR